MLVVSILDIDDVECGRVYRCLEATALLVDAINFVAAVIDLDPRDGPAVVRGHGPHGLAFLPVVYRYIAIGPGLDGCCGHDNQTKGGQDAAVHCRSLSASERSMGPQADRHLTNGATLLQLPVSWRLD